MPSAAVRVVRRPSPWRDRLRRYKVVVDGQMVGALAWDESKDFPIEPGPHKVRIKIDWTGSSELTFAANDGQIVEFECMPAGSAFFGALRAFVAPHHYVDLRPRTENAKLPD